MQSLSLPRVIVRASAGGIRDDHKLAYSDIDGMHKGVLRSVSGRALSRASKNALGAKGKGGGGEGKSALRAAMKRGRAPLASRRAPTV